MDRAAQSASADSSTEASDEIDLMRRIGGGDTAAYRVMADRYLARVTSFSQRMLGSRAEAEDVVQETFLRLWTQASHWQPQAKPSTWLFRIARNLCIDQLRKRRDTEPDTVDRQSAGDRPSSLLDRKQTAELVARALAELPEKQRAALTLVHYDGMSQAEAAEILELSVDALESQLARGRRSLRERLAALRPVTGETP